MEKNEIIEIIQMMNALYPNRKMQLDIQTVSNWKMMFEEYSKEQVINSIKDLSKKIKYIPNIPEILENINSVFKVETLTLGKGYVVRVRYVDELFQFKFVDKEQANNIINILKSIPSREEVRNLYLNNLMENNPHVVFKPESLVSKKGQKYGH